MIYQGRDLDIVSLWSELIDIPQNECNPPLPSYFSKVQCPNPSHDTHKQHFQVNTRQPLVHCFARCGISGSYEHAIALILGISEKDARRFILKHTRSSIGKNDISAYRGQGKRKTVLPDDPVAVDERRLLGGEFTYLPKEVRAYLDDRGIDEPSRGKWQIGWSEDEERIVIPAFDQSGRFCFLIKRKVSGSSSQKYLYTTGAIKSSLLFGACYLDAAQVRSDGLVLVEGSLDTIHLHQLGIRNAVGVLGSGLSTKQVRIIDRIGPRRINLWFDKDSAGVDNIADARDKLRRIPLFVVKYPKHRNDPAEMSGSEAERQLSRAVPISQFYRSARNARKGELAYG